MLGFTLNFFRKVGDSPWIPLYNICYDIATSEDKVQMHWFHDIQFRMTHSADSYLMR